MQRLHYCSHGASVSPTILSLCVPDMIWDVTECTAHALFSPILHFYVNFNACIYCFLRRVYIFLSCWCSLCRYDWLLCGHATKACWDLQLYTQNGPSDPNCSQAVLVLASDAKRGLRDLGVEWDLVWHRDLWTTQPDPTVIRPYSLIKQAGFVYSSWSSMSCLYVILYFLINCRFLLAVPFSRL